MSGVSLRDVTVERGGVDRVERIHLDVAPGEWVGLVGPNGAGKSTVLGAISGILPHRGLVEVGGEPISTLSPAARARRVAMVPQRPVIPPGVEVIDYVMLGRAPYAGRFGVESVGDVVAANEALRSLGLVELGRRRVDELSGGEQQRVVIARSLAQASPVLLLDEPTSALDVGVRIDVLDHIDHVRRDRRLTVISAIHDLTLAAQFCDRLVMIADGSVVADGPAAGVLTVDRIGRHYGARVRVINDPDGGVIVIPTRASDPDSAEADAGGNMGAEPSFGSGATHA